MSSTHPTYGSQLCLDGDVNTFCHSRSDPLSPDLDPRLIVTYPCARRVVKVEVENRRDCCTGRITAFRMRFWDELNSDMAAQYPFTTSAPTYTITPGGGCWTLLIVHQLTCGNLLISCCLQTSLVYAHTLHTHTSMQHLCGWHLRHCCQCSTAAQTRIAQVDWLVGFRGKVGKGLSYAGQQVTTAIDKPPCLHGLATQHSARWANESTILLSVTIADRCCPTCGFAPLW